MTEIISRVRIYIDYSKGNFQLLKVKSYDVTSEKKVDVVKAVGVRGGAGFRRETGGGEISLDVYRETKDPEVNWLQLEDSEEKFAMVIQDEGGLREQYRSVTVSNADRKGDEAGNNMQTVKLKFLQRGVL